MAKNMVIVESPAKAKTINKILGKDFIVKASMGHVRDLPIKNIGIDIEHGFEPKYTLVQGRKKIIDELKNIDPNTLTPLQALQKLDELKKLS